MVLLENCQLLVWRKGRLALPKGEGQGEGCSMRLGRLRNSNPSPQSSPLAKGRDGTTARTDT
jgi:hypothetical protein